MSHQEAWQRRANGWQVREWVVHEWVCWQVREWVCPVVLCCIVWMHYVASWEWALSYDVDESCDITCHVWHEWGMSIHFDMWMRHVKKSYGSMWMSHVTSRGAQFWQQSRQEKSWRVHTWITWPVISCECVMLCHVDESCHLMWMSHVISCDWVMLCHVDESCHESLNCGENMETKTFLRGSYVNSVTLSPDVNEWCRVMWMSHVISRVFEV